ncbi:hypothetical protein ACHWQZ_G010839 [Mnemiopsis leidyi]
MRKEKRQPDQKQEKFKNSTWFDTEECVLIAAPINSTDYSVFAERDVNRDKSGTQMNCGSRSRSGTGTKDDEEGNVYISNDDL